MGAIRRAWLIAVLILAACASNGGDPPAVAPTAVPMVSTTPAPSITALPVEIPNFAASPSLSPPPAAETTRPSPVPSPTPMSDLPAEGPLNPETGGEAVSDPVVNHPPSPARADSAQRPQGHGLGWRDIAPGAADEGGHGQEEYSLPPGSLKDAWVEVSPHTYRVVRPATGEELGGFRVIPPPPDDLGWITRCVNHHADPAVDSSWPQDVRVSQAVLGCTASAGLMEQAIQRYGADRECVQQAYSDDYNVFGGQGNSWTQCPTIGNPTPLDGRPFAEKCRDMVLRGLELKGHPRSERVAAETCPLFEADLNAHLSEPGVTRLCAEHWVLNDVLNAEAPGAVPGLQDHVGVNTSGTC